MLYLCMISDDTQNREKQEYPDETSYLLSTGAMRQHLAQSMQDAIDGKVKAIAIDDLWK